MKVSNIFSPFSTQFSAMLIFVMSIQIMQPLAAKEDPEMVQRVSMFHHFNGDVISFLSAMKENNKIAVVSHRGGIAPGFPENSSRSIIRSITMGSHIIEIDVNASADGVNVLHHDDYLDRTTTGSGKFKDKSWEYLKSLRLKDQSNAVIEEGLLTFDEFLTLVDQSVFLLLDLKSPSSELEIVTAVQEKNMLKSTIFIAYNIAQAKRIKSANHEAVIAMGKIGNTADLQRLDSEELTNKPIVALMGDINEVGSRISTGMLDNHYILVGSYIGFDSLDAKIEAGCEFLIATRAVERGVAMIVSNQPLAMHRCLMRMGLSE